MESGGCIYYYTYMRWKVLSPIALYMIQIYIPYRLRVVSSYSFMLRLANDFALIMLYIDLKCSINLCSISSKNTQKCWNHICAKLSSNNLLEILVAIQIFAIKDVFEILLLPLSLLQGLSHLYSS